MTLDQYREYCISKPGTTEELPFGPDVLVLKVMGKMFTLASLTNFDRISLKVDPEIGVELRERYDSVVPAYHMNKMHWVNVIMDGKIGDVQIKKWIDDSYNLVVAKLPKKDRAKLEQLVKPSTKKK